MFLTFIVTIKWTWMGDWLWTCSLNHFRIKPTLGSTQPSISLLSLIEYRPMWLGLWRGTFVICIGWQVTLYDPIWQVTLHSSKMDFPCRAASSLTMSMCFCFGRWFQHMLTFCIRWDWLTNFRESTLPTKVIKLSTLSTRRNGSKLPS